MVRKLFAVIVAATLMAGSAWGAAANSFDNTGGGTAPGGTAPSPAWSAWTATALPTSAGTEVHGIVSNKAGGSTLTATGDIVIGDGTAGALLIGAAGDGTIYTTHVSPIALNLAKLTVNSASASATKNADIWVGAGNSLKITGLLTVTAAGVGGSAGTNLGSIADGAGSVIQSGSLDFSTSAKGFITVRNGGTYKNLATTATTITGTNNTDGLQFMGGAMSFAGALTTTIGTIYATTGTNNLAVGGAGLELAGASTTATNAVISAAGGSTLNVLKSLDDTDLADVTLKHSNLKIEGSSIINVGKLTVTAGQAAFVSSGSPAGTLKATSLKVAGASNSDVFTDVATIATEVSGESLVESGTYTVAGTNNKYEGGLNVKTDGILTAASATTITTGTDTTDQYVTLYNDATLKVTGANTFTINGAGVKIVESAVAGTATNIDATDNAASAIAIQNDLIVDGNLNLKTNGSATAGITVGNDYVQKSGTVTEVGAGPFAVAGTGKIGGEGKAATYKVASVGTGVNTTTFTGGLTIGEQGTLEATAVTNAVALGADTTLKLDGGAINAVAATTAFNLDGTGTTVEVSKAGSVIQTGATGGFVADDSLLKVNAALDNTPSLNVTGLAGASFDDIQVLKGELALGAGTTLKTDNDVIVKSGAFLSNAGASTITATAGGAFTAEKGSYIEAEGGNYTLTGFASTELNGNMLIGETGGVLHQIIDAAGTETKIGKDAVISLTMAAAQAAQAAPGTLAVITSAAPANLTIDAGAKSQNSGLGQFVFDKDPTTGNIFVMEANNILTGVADEADRGQNLANMQQAWGDKYGTGSEIDITLANASYDAAGYNTVDGLSVVSDPSGLTNEWGIDGFGQLGLDLLASAASTTNSARYSEGVGKSVLRNGNVSETLTAGVGEIRGVTSAIGSRNVQLRGQMAGANSVSYEYANPSLSLNNDYANRIWAGYIGQWEKGDSRNGVSGYDYDSNGFIVGYDRLVGCNFAFGGAFAYSRGDYEDKAALSNSSKIDNYSFSGYATYSALNGAFASLFGGYTHQKSDINATYRGGSIGSTGVTSRTSDYDSDYWNIGGQLGYDFQPVDGLVLTPSIGLQYIHGRSDSHFAWARDSLGAMGGHVSGTTQKSLLLPIELAARYNIDFSNCSRLAIEGNIGYSYNFMDDNGAASMQLANVETGAGNAVIIDGYDRDASRHTFNAGAGLRYAYNRFDIGVKYDYYLQQDAHAHRLMGTVGVSF